MARVWPGRLARLMASLLLGFAVFWVLDAQAIFARLQTAAPLWILASCASLTVVTALMALRWQWVARGLDLDLRYGPALREYYLSQLVNQLVPGGIVGDAARAVRLRHRGDMERAATSVVIDRLLGQAAFLAVLGLSVSLDLLRPGGIAWPIWSGAVVGFGVILAYLLWQWRRPQGALARGLNHLRAHLLRVDQLALNALITMLLIFAFYACGRSVGAVLSPMQAATLVPLILSAMVIPLSVGGWGWREGAAAGLFPLAGFSAEVGVATGIAYGGVLLISALPALVCLLPHGSSGSPDT